MDREASTQRVTSVRMNRWVILAGYALLTACTQLLWLAYAPITTQTHRIMGVSEGAVGDLAVIFPLMYVDPGAARWPLAGRPVSPGRSASARSSPRAAGCCGWPARRRTAGPWPASS